MVELRKDQKIGIIGAGKISEKHIIGYKNIGCQEIYITDINLESSRRIADKFKVKFTEKAEVLYNECDVIDVCTPVTSHKDIIQMALEKGCHVFCEKPLCQNLDEADEIKRIAEKYDRLVMVGYLYRFHPGFQQVKKWIDANLIGDIHFGLFRIGGRGNHQKWKHIKSSGGGCINEMLIHKLDLINYFIGHIDSVQTLSKEILLTDRTINGEKFTADAEDNILLKLTSGKIKLICQADFTTPSYMEYLELHGEYGSIFTSILGHFPTVLFLSEASGIYNQGNNILKFDQVNLFELELNHFLECIEKEQHNINSIDDSIGLMETMAKIK